MPKGLVRYQRTGVFHFITFSCYQRQPLLGTPAAYAVFERGLVDKAGEGDYAFDF